MKFVGYTNIGKRSVNEDSIRITDNCLIVCDGLGGETKGRLASNKIADFIQINLNIEHINLAKLEDLIVNSHRYINSSAKSEPELEGMATTLATVVFGTEGLWFAHIGDSRVYLVRPSEKIFWQTWDHSPVGDLLKNKKISREQARKHPLNHQINRSIKANTKDKLTKPEILFTDDIRDNDIIFLCTDGVFEAFSDLDLLLLLADKDLTIGDKIALIKNKCRSYSFDNNSAIICQLDNVSIQKENIVPLNWMSIKTLE